MKNKTIINYGEILLKAGRIICPLCAIILYIIVSSAMVLDPQPEFQFLVSNALLVIILLALTISDTKKHRKVYTWLRSTNIVVPLAIAIFPMATILLISCIVDIGISAVMDFKSRANLDTYQLFLGLKPYTVIPIWLVSLLTTYLYDNRIFHQLRDKTAAL